MLKTFCNKFKRKSKEVTKSSLKDLVESFKHHRIYKEVLYTDFGMFYVMTFNSTIYEYSDKTGLQMWPLLRSMSHLTRDGISVSTWPYLEKAYPDCEVVGICGGALILVPKENWVTADKIIGENMNEVKIESRDSIRFGDIIVKDDTAHIVTLDHAANYIVLVKLANGTTRAFSAVGYVIGSQVNIVGILANAGFNNYRVIRNPEIIIREK